jgi:hypothetical protein
MALGGFTNITFIDTVAPAINAAALNSIYSAVDEIDDELAYSKRKFNLFDMKKEWLNRNTADGYTFSNLSEVSAESNCDASLDYDNVVHGATSLRMTKNTTADTNIFVRIEPTYAFDLDEYRNGGSSGTSDTLTFCMYISDISLLDGNFTIFFGQDSSNYYAWTIANTSLRTGWNFIYVQKSSLGSGTGSPSFNAIDWVQIQADTDTGYQNEYISLSFFNLQKEYDSEPNPTQQTDGAGTPTWTNYFDNLISDSAIMHDEYLDETGYMMAYQASGSELYQMKLLFNEDKFIYYNIKTKAFAKAGEDYTHTIYWDSGESSDYVYTWVENGTFKLYDSDSATTTSVALTNTIEVNGEYDLMLERVGDTLRAIFHNISADELHVLEFETSLSAEYGSIWFGKHDNNMCAFITDIKVNYARDIDLQKENKNEVLMAVKESDETRSNTSTVANDDELYIKGLKADSLYKIETHLFVTGTSNNGDFKYDYGTTGTISSVSKRIIHAGGTSATNMTNCSNVKVTGHTSFGTDVSAGVDNDINGIYDSQIIRINKGFGQASIRLRWSQNTSHADSITLLAGSYMMLTRLGKGHKVNKGTN